jgi:two-component system phosphate regulon sensor histidine kinase PhoR
MKAFFAQLSLRQKILYSYIAVFLFFITAMYLFSSNIVTEIVYRSLRERSAEIVEKIKNEADDYALVQKLKDQRYLIFFRVGLITDERKLLYDSYTRRLLGPDFNQNLAKHPEVEQAFLEGVGYYEGDSELLGQRFVYMATAFDFHGKTYILRTAFPYKFVGELSHDIKKGLIGLSVIVLLLFSVMSWYLVHRLTQPLHEIITAIRPYQSGQLAELPEVKVDPRTYEEARLLADTLNTLSTKIQSHIDLLTLERNETSSVLESLVEGVIAVDDKMVVTYANPVALSLLCLTKEELIGKNFSVAHLPECSDLILACRQSNKWTTKNLEVERKGRLLHLDVIVVPKSNQGGAVLVLEDKSAEHRLEAMRKDFIANASHELKTPITIIRGFAETLHDNPNLPKETFDTITEKILHNCNRMSALVKDLLLLTDIEHIPQSRLINCDLASLAESCCHTLQDLHPEAKVTFHQLCKEAMTLQGDPSLLELAIMNLLENAAKYSQAPAQIAVTLDRQQNDITLSIADKGIGIPSEDLDYIFQRFYRVDKARSRKLGGSGLGLSIVKTIVEKHGGKISVASKLGQGSAFTINMNAS